jgi:copper chaperone CopZ
MFTSVKRWKRILIQVLVAAQLIIRMKRALLFSFLAFTSAIAAADTSEMKVYGLACAFCAQGIEKTLRKNPASEDVVVSLEHQLGQDIPDSDLTKALTDAGYDVKGIARTQRPMAEVRAGLKQAAK